MHNPDKIIVQKQVRDLLERPWHKSIQERFVAKIKGSHQLFPKRIDYYVSIPFETQYTIEDFIKEYAPEPRSIIHMVQHYSTGRAYRVKTYLRLATPVFLEEMMD